MLLKTLLLGSGKRLLRVYQTSRVWTTAATTHASEPPAAHRRLGAERGRDPYGEVRATPTASYRSLVAQLADRSMGRRYRALALGQLEASEGVIEAPLIRMGKRLAQSSWAPFCSAPCSPGRPSTWPSRAWSA